MGNSHENGVKGPYTPELLRLGQLAQGESQLLDSSGLSS